MQQIRKRDSLVIKFTIIAIVFSVIVLSVTGVLTYMIQTDTYTKQCLDITRNVNRYLEYLMQKEGQNTVDYIDYYMDHYRDVKMKWDFDDYEDAMNNYEKIMNRDHPDRTLYVDTAFDELSDEAKEAFFIYDQQYWVTTFEAARDAFGMSYTYFLVMGDPRSRTDSFAEKYDNGDYDSEHSALYLIDGERTEETDESGNGTGYLYLGDTYYNAYDEEHKVEWDTWNSGEQIEAFQEWDNERGHTYAYYTPLVINGRKLGLVVSELEVENVNQGILYSSLMMTACVAAVFIVLLTAAIVLINKFYISKLARLESDITDFTNSKNYDIADSIKKLAKGRNEITSLSEKTANMISEIKNHVDEIKDMSIKQEKINTELGVATKIQADMMPTEFPKHAGFDLYATMTPAKEVGGDFYDFFFIDDDHLGLVIADVSGKGVPAALFMAITKTVLRNSAINGRTPSKSLELTSNIMCQGNRSGFFVTAWLGILTLSTGELTYSNAGHEYPALMHEGKEYKLIEGDNMPPLATMENMEYFDETLTLQSGDRLFLYTDGVPEAKNSEAERFGIERMLETLNCSKNAGPEELLEKVKSEVDSFAGDNDPFDDVTMMSVVWKGATAPPNPSVTTL